MACKGYGVCRTSSALSNKWYDVYGIRKKHDDCWIQITCSCSELEGRWEIDTATKAMLYQNGNLVSTKDVTGAKSVRFTNLPDGEYLLQVSSPFGGATKRCTIPGAPTGCLNTEIESLVVHPEGSGTAVTASWTAGPFCGYRVEITRAGKVEALEDVEVTHVRFDSLIPETAYCITVRGKCPPCLGIPKRGVLHYFAAFLSRRSAGSRGERRLV